MRTLKHVLSAATFLFLAVSAQAQTSAASDAAAPATVPSVVVPEATPVAIETPAGAPTKTWGEQAKSAVQAVLPIKNPRVEAQYLATINYSPMEFPIPNKFGATVGMIKNPRQTWELEYLNSSLSVPGGFRDLGGISDTRFGVIGRTFFGNSFHLSYGVSHFDLRAKLGDGLMNRVSGGAYPSMEIMRVRGLGFNAGMGNVWTFRNNFTIGIDWVAWAQPLMVTDRSSDYLKVSNGESSNRYFDDTLKIITYLPRLSVLNLHAGMLF